MHGITVKFLCNICSKCMKLTDNWDIISVFHTTYFISKATQEI